MRHFLQHFRSTSANPRLLARRLREVGGGGGAAAATTAAAGDGHTVAGGPQASRGHHNTAAAASSSTAAAAAVVVDRHGSLWNMLVFLGDAVYGALRAEIIQVQQRALLCPLPCCCCCVCVRAHACAHTHTRTRVVLASARRVSDLGHCRQWCQRRVVSNAQKSATAAHAPARPLARLPVLPATHHPRWRSHPVAAVSHFVCALAHYADTVPSSRGDA